MNKALSEIKLVKSVGSLQAQARVALARNRHREQQKCLELVAPDVTGMQATSRLLGAPGVFCVAGTSSEEPSCRYDTSGYVAWCTPMDEILCQDGILPVDTSCRRYHLIM